MVKFTKLILKNQKGFTLVEVMIAIVIFAIFSAVFVAGFGQGLLDSGNFKDEITLKDIADNKLNEIITSPPTLDEALTLSVDKKEVENFPDYETLVKYKKFVAPDFSKIMGAQDSLEQTDEEKEEEAFRQKIADIYKKNLEAFIWQVEVTARNKNTDRTFKMTTWIINNAAKVDIGAF